MVSCCSQISSFLPKETSWFFQTSVLHFPKKIINALVTQPSLCQARHFLLTIAHPSSSAAGLLLELSMSLSLQLGHPRRLHDNTRASCSEGEAVHGEHGRAGAGGQRAWEGKEIWSAVIFPSGPAFLEKSLMYGNIFGAQRALLFCQASGGKESKLCTAGK